VAKKPKHQASQKRYSKDVEVSKEKVFSNNMTSPMESYHNLMQEKNTLVFEEFEVVANDEM
jgi:hypothetical protein